MELEDFLETIPETQPPAWISLHSAPGLPPHLSLTFTPDTLFVVSPRDAKLLLKGTGCGLDSLMPGLYYNKRCMSEGKFQFHH